MYVVQITAYTNNAHVMYEKGFENKILYLISPLNDFSIILQLHLAIILHSTVIFTMVVCKIIQSLPGFQNLTVLADR